MIDAVQYIGLAKAVGLFNTSFAISFLDIANIYRQGIARSDVYECGQKQAMNQSVKKVCHYSTGTLGLQKPKDVTDRR